MVKSLSLGNLFLALVVSFFKSCCLSNFALKRAKQFEFETGISEMGEKLKMASLVSRLRGENEHALYARESSFFDASYLIVVLERKSSGCGCICWDNLYLC